MRIDQIEDSTKLEVAALQATEAAVLATIAAINVLSPGAIADAVGQRMTEAIGRLTQQWR
jgi:UPF0716 family protein affecting phage T7 exclusion